MTQTGRLRERVTFQTRGNDANGDPLGAWGGGFTVSADVVPLKRGEAVLQSRLQGVQPIEITVRRSSVTLAISTAHRARWNGTPYNIRAAAPSTDRRWLVILAEADGSDE